MTQCLRILSALADDMDWVHSTHMVSIEDLGATSSLQGCCILLMPIHTYVQAK